MLFKIHYMLANINLEQPGHHSAYYLMQILDANTTSLELAAYVKLKSHLGHLPTWMWRPFPNQA